jgi:hypothetical protein
MKMVDAGEPVMFEGLPPPPEPPVVADEHPIRHDGWRSRKLWCCVGGALIIWLATCLLFYVSGTSPEPFLDQVYWLYGMILGAVVLLFGLGLLTVDKLLEIIKLIKGVNGKKAP